VSNRSEADEVPQSQAANDMDAIPAALSMSQKNAKQKKKTGSKIKSKREKVLAPVSLAIDDASNLVITFDEDEHVAADFDDSIELTPDATSAGQKFIFFCLY
jgi:hypothetical protein